MNALEQFLLWITYFNLAGNRWNILGVLWLTFLVTIIILRLARHFQAGFLPQPHGGYKECLWWMAVLIFGFLITFLFQMLMDDLITTPINLVFGSWALLAPQLGAFSFWKLLMFKVDVYGLIFLYSLALIVTRVSSFFQFTKRSAFWLSVTLAFQLLLASQHVFYFLNLSGYDRLITFWVSYPWFRIMTGFLAASIIKKPGAKP